MVAPPRRPSDPVRAFLEEVSKRRPPLAGYLESAEDLRFEDGLLLVTVPAGDTYLDSRLRQESNRQVMEEALASVWGPGTSWRVAAGASAPKAAAPAEAKSAGAQQVEQIPAVQAVLEIFPGSRVEAVEEQGSYTED
jgi:hypothetical protein